MMQDATSLSCQCQLRGDELNCKVHGLSLSPATLLHSNRAFENEQ